MIGTAIKAMGRRGILRGALGLGAAVGIGAPQTQIGGGMTPRVSLRDLSGNQTPRIPSSEPDPPAWLDALHKDANAVDRARHTRPTFDGLDLDLAMLRSPSPAYKIVKQRVRDEAWRRRQETLWEKFWSANAEWRRSLGL
jgi:hypothetical protein